MLIVDNAKHEDQISHDQLTNDPSTRNQHEDTQTDVLKTKPNNSLVEPCNPR